MRILIPFLLLAGVSTLFSAMSSAGVTPYKADYPAPTVPNDSLAMIASGEKLFNKTLPCGACHGYHLERGNAGVPSLRTLNIRYDSSARTVFRTAINEGREAKGMPKWNFLTDKQKQQIETYIFSLQASS